jgi:hypothetical protein
MPTPKKGNKGQGKQTRKAEGKSPIRTAPLPKGTTPGKGMGKK